MSISYVHGKVNKLLFCVYTQRVRFRHTRKFVVDTPSPISVHKNFRVRLSATSTGTRYYIYIFPWYGRDEQLITNYFFDMLEHGFHPFKVTVNCYNLSGRVKFSRLKSCER